MAASAGTAAGHSAAAGHSGTPDADLAADLDAAIAAAYAADATLPTLATGGIHGGMAGDRDRMPYVVFHEAAIKVVGNPLGRYEHRTIRFNCYARTGALADAIGEAVIAAYHLKPLAFAGGYLMSARWTGGSTIPAHRRGVDNDRVWNRTLLFTFTVGRQVP